MFSASCLSVPSVEPGHVLSSAVMFAAVMVNMSVGVGGGLRQSVVGHQKTYFSDLPPTQVAAQMRCSRSVADGKGVYFAISQEASLMRLSRRRELLLAGVFAIGCVNQGRAASVLYGSSGLV